MQLSSDDNRLARSSVSSWYDVRIHNSSHQEEHPAVIVPNHEDKRMVHLEVFLAECTWFDCFIFVWCYFLCSCCSLFCHRECCPEIKSKCKRKKFHFPTIFLSTVITYIIGNQFYRWAIDVKCSECSGDISVRSDLASSKISTKPIAFNAFAIDVPVSLPIWNLGNLKLTTSFWM